MITGPLVNMSKLYLFILYVTAQFIFFSNTRSDSSSIPNPDVHLLLNPDSSHVVNPNSSVICVLSDRKDNQELCLQKANPDFWGTPKTVAKKVSFT